MLRRNANHEMSDAIQRERLSDDVRIGTHLVLPVAVPHNHRGFSRERVIACRVESGASCRRHAERPEVIRRDEHRLQGLHARVRWRLNRDLAGPASPADHRDSGIRGAKGLEIRIRPPVAARARGTRRRDDFDQSLRVHPGRRHPEYSRPVRNRDDQRHADAERHDADDCERSSLRQRSAGMNQVAAGAVEHAKHQPINNFPMQSLTGRPMPPVPSLSVSLIAATTIGTARERDRAIESARAASC